MTTTNLANLTPTQGFVEPTELKPTDEAFNSDTTYTDLGYVCQKGDKTELVNLASRMLIESKNDKDIFSPTSIMEQNLRCYLFSRPDGELGDDAPTVARIQPTILAQVQAAMRTPPVISFRSATINEDGPTVLIKPYYFAAPKGPDGQNAVNPITGLPYLTPMNPDGSPQVGPDGQPLPAPPGMMMPLYEPIPEGVIERIPEHRRLTVNAETVVRHRQQIFDAMRELSELDQGLRDAVLSKAVQGTVMALNLWDAQAQNFALEPLPFQQWHPDPKRSEIYRSGYVRVDWPADLLLAKRYYPELSAELDAAAQRSINYNAGMSNMSSLFLGKVPAGPMVTLTLCWLRDWLEPMTLAEAQKCGAVSIEEFGEDEQGVALAQGGEAGEDPDEGGEVGADADEGSASIDRDAEGDGQSNFGGNGPRRAGTRIRHAHNHDDLSECFDHDGNPLFNYGDTGDKIHPSHPMKCCIRHWKIARNKVIEDSICEDLDIPVVHDREVPIPDRIWGQSAIERMRSPQNTINAMHGLMTKYCLQFSTQSGFVARDFMSKVDSNFISGWKQIGNFYSVDTSGSADFDIRKMIQFSNPPTMNDSVPKLYAQASADWDIVTVHSKSAQGETEPGVKSGRAIQLLQNANQGVVDQTAQHTELFVRRIALLDNHLIQTRMSAAQQYHWNKSIPLPVLDRYVIPYAKQMVWNCEVRINSGASAVAAERENKNFQRLQAHAIDLRTYLESTDDLNVEEVLHRLDAEAEKLAEQQAAANPPPAPEPKPEGPKESISVQVKYEAMPPESQEVFLKQNLGLPGGAMRHAAKLDAKAQQELAIKAQPKQPPANGQSAGTAQSRVPE